MRIHKFATFVISTYYCVYTKNSILLNYFYIQEIYNLNIYFDYLRATLYITTYYLYVIGYI